MTLWALEDLVHPARDQATVIGEDCIVGHLAHLEGVSHHAVLVRSTSTVLQGSCVDTGAMVAAGALLKAGTEVPSGRRAQGVPAVLVEYEPDVDGVRAGAQTYRELIHLYCRSAAEHPGARGPT
jgi:carbonic anhydrase/acetyltransferase-like protein (isoleucine patch superfamily)